MAWPLVDADNKQPDDPFSLEFLSTMCHIKIIYPDLQELKMIPTKNTLKIKHLKNRIV